MPYLQERDFDHSRSRRAPTHPKELDPQRNWVVHPGFHLQRHHPLGLSEHSYQWLDHYHIYFILRG